MSMVTAAVFDIPAAPTALGVVAVCIVVGYYLLRDRSAFLTQSNEIAGLRKAMDAQAERHRREMVELNEKIARLDGRLEEARTERHKLRGEVAKLRLALGVVNDLYPKCTCGVLDPIAAVMHTLAVEDV